jgi:ketosteroid isomerase-like protein
MRVIRLDLYHTAVFMVLIGCLAHPAHAGGVRLAIEAANARFSAAAARGDSAALAASYAVDGQVMPAGSDVIRGADAIQKFWRRALDSGIGGIGLKTLEVFTNGLTATEVGQYELRDKAGNLLDRGKYIVVWRHEGSKWKLLYDMYSTNVPAPHK